MPHVDLQREELTEKERRIIDILEILRRRGPLTRPDISKELGINVVTISNYIDEFVKNNLVLEKELDISEGGRRPALLELNPQGGYIIGVGLNLMNMVGLLMDLKGNIITKTQIVRPKPSVKEITECLLEIIREILRRSKQYTSNIRGVGIGIAGLISKKTGSIHWPQRQNGRYSYASVDIPLLDLIEREFDLPALVENDATCACFGEYWQSLKGQFKNIVYMFSGVGCGIIINGDIYTGTSGYAGEVSIYNYKEDDLLKCPEQGGCYLKRWEADLGIVDEIKSLLAKDASGAENFFKLTSSNINNVDLKSVFAAAKSNDPIARLALQKGATRLGIRIAYIVNLLNPEVIIIGGGLEEAGEEFLNRVSASIKEWAFRETSENLKIIYSQLRENAVAIGAASLVTQKVFARIL
ncbi:MAG: ROK family protein [Candidatus Omnitrophica bacterium]|nr:ROK family protein [Candidatus Omnitrophota bacterium]MDD5552565.1 ROK family protein [Candidatus Omnitrophota bacterium]